MCDLLRCDQEEEGFKGFVRMFVVPLRRRVGPKQALNVWEHYLRSESESPLRIENILTIELGIPLKGYLRFSTSMETQELAKAAEKKQSEILTRGTTQIYQYTWSSEHRILSDSALRDLARLDNSLGGPVHFFKRAVHHSSESTVTPKGQLQVVIPTSSQECQIILLGDKWQGNEKWGVDAAYVLDEDTILSARNIDYVSLLGQKYSLARTSFPLA